MDMKSYYLYSSKIIIIIIIIKGSFVVIRITSGVAGYNARHPLFTPPPAPIVHFCFHI